MRAEHSNAISNGLAHRWAIITATVAVLGIAIGLLLNLIVGTLGLLLRQRWPPLLA